jgi:uncharacterized alkaline shock family protein YloU
MRVMDSMDGQSHIAADVLCRYAADAARDVKGVTGLVGRHGGVKIEDGSLELRLSVEWGASLPEVGEAVQRRVTEYLGQMADVRPASVDVVIDEIGAP